MDKEWLFEENIRLNKLAGELAEQKKILKLEQEKLSGERKVFEQQRRVLEISFQKLAADKEMFRADIKKQKEKLRQESLEKETGQAESADADGMNHLKGLNFRGPGFFGGVTGYSSLKKRYKELMKIFHPDNRNGDSFTVACINKEYEILKEKYKK